MFSNIIPAHGLVQFNYVKKGEISQKFKRAALQNGKHCLRCQEFMIGFHSIKDLSLYVHGVLDGLIVEDIVDRLDEEEEKEQIAIKICRQFFEPINQMDAEREAELLWIQPGAERKFEEKMEEMAAYMKEQGKKFKLSKMYTKFCWFLNFDTFMECCH